MNEGLKTPLKTIRAHCLSCSGTLGEVAQCTCEKYCELYPLRSGHRTVGMSPIKTIRKYCLACGEGTYKSVVDCEIKNCELYPFRLGKDPRRAKRILTDEQRTKIRERFELAKSS